MPDLADKKCKPCEGGVPPLSAEAATSLMDSLDAEWILETERGFIERTFEFPAYSRTIAFTNAIAWIATNEGHHPELTVKYGSCKVRYFTTAIAGLSDNDFICAAKIDRLAQEL
ncbi:MAG: 4a-hydroxytetrahydrobiopterin dehydratase [Woeseiaceae bacterium]